jgi:hypothetical protein
MDKEQFDANVRGAIYDFAGYLTTLDDSFMVGAKHNATRMSEEISIWFAKNSLGPTGAFPTSLPLVNTDWACAPK